MIRFIALLLVVMLVTPAMVVAATTVDQLDDKLKQDKITDIAAMTGEVQTIKVFQDKNTSATVVTEVGAKDTMVLLERDGDWVRVAVEAGIGYVSVQDFVRYLEGKANDDLLTDPPTTIDRVPPPTTPPTPPPTDTGRIQDPPVTPPVTPEPPTTPTTPPTPPPTDTGRIQDPPVTPPVTSEPPTTPTPPVIPPTPETPKGVAMALTHFEPVWVRSEQSLESTALIVIPTGATVNLLETSGAWCKVEYQGKIGWVRAKYLGFRNDGTAGNAAGAPGIGPGVTDPAAGIAVGGDVKIIHNTPVHMRMAKTLASDCPVVIPVGGGLKLLADEGDWVKVEYDGKIGYVRKKYVASGSGYVPRRITDSTPTPPVTPPVPPTTPSAPPAAPPTPPVTPPTPPVTPPTPPPATPPTTGSTPAPPVTPPVATDTSSPAYKVFELTNKERQGLGGTAFVFDAKLSAVAQAHAEDMAKRNFFNHTNPDGKSPFQRMSAAGIGYSTAGENIALNSSPEGAVRAWMNSAGHRRNILNASFKKIGVGVYQGRYVQVFTN